MITMDATTTTGRQAGLDIEKIRSQFPILQREIEGQALCYLDSAATSQKPLQVIEAISDYYRNHNANIHRGVYRVAGEATELYEGARRKIAARINAGFEEVIFVRNATEAINLVAASWGRSSIGAGDRILITEMEHHSNIVPWQMLAQDSGAVLEYVPITDEGLLDDSKLDELLAQGPKLVAVTHISNVLSTINDVGDIAKRAHAAGAKLLVDGAQAAPHLALDMQRTGADFYAFTGHKMYGPTGIGVLYARRELLEQMPPFLGGGDMISKVGWQQSSWNDLPWKFEAGTSAIAEGAGLGAACDWLGRLDMEAVAAHEADLTHYALERLSDLPGLRVFGPPATDGRAPVISFEIEGVHPHDVAQILDRSAVCIRAGHHCAQPLMRKLGVPATSRASFGIYNTRADVDRLIVGLEEVRRVFQL